MVWALSLISREKDQMSADAAAERRWATARSLADGVRDAGMSRRRLRVLLWLGGLLLSSWALGFLLAAVLPSGRSSGADGGLPPGFFVGMGVSLLGFLCALVGFIWAKRTGRYITRWKQVVSPLKLSERRWVLKQIRGKIEPDIDKLPILTAFARQLRAATLGVAPLFAGVALMGLGVGLSARNPLILWLEVAAVVLFVLAGLLMARDYRLAGRFLERYDHAKVLQ